MVSGTVATGFEGVRSVFIDNFTERGDVGASVCAFVNGDKVVDLWGGMARDDVAWEEDTVTTVWSTTKGATVLTVQALVDRGALDVDATVASYWPEFARAGKAEITLRDVLCHGAGVIDFPDYADVVSFDEPAGWLHTDEITRRIAAAEPWWERGTRHGYHALTFGWILGEVVRRVTGRSLGSVFRSSVADPLDIDFWIGVPRGVLPRVADLIAAPPIDDPAMAALARQMMGYGSDAGRALFVGRERGVEGAASLANTDAYRIAEVPAGNGVTNARGVAKMYAALAMGGQLDGVRIVSPDSVEAFRVEQFSGTDAILQTDRRYALGYMLPTESSGKLGWGSAVFGHPGMGGSTGFADAQVGLGFGYVMNQLYRTVQDDKRAEKLIASVYDALHSAR